MITYAAQRDVPSRRVDYDGIERLWSIAVASVRNRSQIRRRLNRLKEANPLLCVATACREADMVGRG